MLFCYVTSGFSEHISIYEQSRTVPWNIPLPEYITQLGLFDSYTPHSTSMSIRCVMNNPQHSITSMLHTPYHEATTVFTQGHSEPEC